MHYQTPADNSVKLAIGMQGRAWRGGAWAVEILTGPTVDDASSGKSGRFLAAGTGKENFPPVFGNQPFACWGIVLVREGCGG